MTQPTLCNTNKQKCRGWTITINNYTNADIKTLKELGCEYLFQEETGKNGTPHIQGMLYFKNAVSFNSIKNALPTAHIEKMKSKIASIKYCSKKETRSGQIYTNMDIPTNDDTEIVEQDEKLDPSEKAKIEAERLCEDIRFWTQLKFERPDLYEKYKKDIPKDVMNFINLRLPKPN